MNPEESSVSKTKLGRKCFKYYVVVDGVKGCGNIEEEETC